MPKKYADIVPNKWYIIDIRNIRKPRYLAKTYETQGQAKAVIKRYFNIYTFIALKGRFPIKYGLSRSRKKYGYIEKYNYETNFTRQDKKTRRTLERYYQRRRRQKAHKKETYIYPSYITTKSDKSAYRQRQRFGKLRKIKREY